MIYDYYKKVETRTSELGIVTEKAIEFREFDFDEGFIRGESYSLMAPAWSFWNT